MYRTLLQTLVVLLAVPASANGLLALKQTLSDNDIGAEFCVTGVVTRGTEKIGNAFILEDDDCALALFNHAVRQDARLTVGNLVSVFGKINRGVSSGRPAADVETVRTLARGKAREPLDVTPERLSDPTLIHRLVRIEGIVQDSFRDELDRNWFFLVLNCENNLVYINCHQTVHDAKSTPCIGDTVSVTGFCAGKFGKSRKMISRSIALRSAKDIRILRKCSGRALQTSDIENFSFFEKPRNGATSALCSAHGRILAVWDSGNVLLRTDTGSLVKGEIAQPPFPSWGDSIELTGHPETDLYDPILVRASWQPAHEGGSRLPETKPQNVTVGMLHANDPTFQLYDFAFHGAVVRLRGTVRSLPLPGGDGRVSLECDSRIVTVDVSSVPKSVHGLETGFGIEVTGVCVMLAEKMSLNRTIPRIRGFILVPRTAGDIRVVSRPSWWTPLRLSVVLGLSLVLLGSIAVWNFTLRRLAEKRARQLADEEVSHVRSELKVSERTRLAVELHDTLSQNITGACLKVNAAEQLLEAHPQAAAEHLSVAAKTLVSCRNEIRNCLWDLRSQALEEETMDRAIRKTLEPHLDGSADISVRFAVPRTLFTDNTAHVLLCIVRELVLNAVRHGRATAVKVAGCAENGKILFSVQDNGCGFDPAACPGVRDGHFGLQGIRERMKVLGGTVELTSERDVGTKVRIAMPLPTEKGEKV